MSESLQQYAQEQQAATEQSQPQVTYAQMPAQSEQQQQFTYQMPAQGDQQQVVYQMPPQGDLGYAQMPQQGYAQPYPMPGYAQQMVGVAGQPLMAQPLYTHIMAPQVVKAPVTIGGELGTEEVNLLNKNQALKVEIQKMHAEAATKSAQTTHSAQLEQSAEEKGRGLAEAQEQVSQQQHKLEEEVAELRAILERKDDHCRNLEIQLQDMKNNFPLASSPVSTSADAKKIESLQQTIERKDAQIRDLQATLARRQNTLKTSLESAVQKSRVVARNGGSDFGQLFEGPPAQMYKSGAPDDSVDLHFQEFYNSTSSCVPLKRINAGLYFFGKKQVSIKLMGAKLMACTEDSWNNGKFGSIMKFMAGFENEERIRLGVPEVEIPRRALA